MSSTNIIKTCIQRESQQDNVMYRQQLKERIGQREVYYIVAAKNAVYPARLVIHKRLIMLALKYGKSIIKIIRQTMNYTKIAIKFDTIDSIKARDAMWDIVNTFNVKYDICFEILKRRAFKIHKRDIEANKYSIEIEETIEEEQDDADDDDGDDNGYDDMIPTDPNTPETTPLKASDKK